MIFQIKGVKILWRRNDRTSPHFDQTNTIRMHAGTGLVSPNIRSPPRTVTSKRVDHSAIDRIRSLQSIHHKNGAFPCLPSPSPPQTPTGSASTRKIEPYWTSVRNILSWLFFFFGWVLPRTAVSADVLSINFETAVRCKARSTVDPVQNWRGLLVRVRSSRGPIARFRSSGIYYESLQTGLVGGRWKSES